MRGFLIRKIIHPIKIVYKRLFHINDTPEKIALGFALGAFIGVFPTFGLGGLLVLGLCYWWRLNYLGAIAGSIIVMNPITSPLFWAVSAWLGSQIYSTDTRIIIDSLKNGVIFRHLDEITVVYLTGNIIVSTVVAVISYYVVKTVIINRRLEAAKE